MSVAFADTFSSPFFIALQKQNAQSHCLRVLAVYSIIPQLAQRWVIGAGGMILLRVTYYYLQITFYREIK